ncbi:protein kinase [candidate division CSSED10-310 bacterium]|uniref:Protein kinase n=1 Tax=candidate division CSSED10-310 bacterium TaxID=2855610 RepID=A0ABV6Z2J5_UNCC1
MKCPRCGNKYPTEIGACPHCVSLKKKTGMRLGRDFISRLFAGDLPHGTPFGTRYDVEGLLGRGGMGIVYKAVDKVLHEKVAIKLLNPLFSSDKDINERFKQEIKLARKINHKNVIRIYDMGTVDGIRYISMEYVQGKDLKDVIRAEGGGLPLNFAILIIRQIAEGLQVAHDLGIIHRDIKPQNILIQKNGEVKILDYGIARLVGTKDLTQTGSLLGSPVYMSPEQASGKETDSRSDIYSFGVIMFEIFTGRIPFLADTPIATALKHVNEQPPRPTSINPDIPIWVENVIIKAMEKDPFSRFQHAKEIVDPVYGLHIDRLSDTDILVCPHCGKHNPLSNSACANCQSFLGREMEDTKGGDILRDEELIVEEKRLLKSASMAFNDGKLQVSKDRLERILILNASNEKAQQMLHEVENKITREKKVNLYHQNALISYQDKKYDDAIALWEKILTFDPNIREARTFLEKAREEQSIYDRIKGHVNKGLQFYNQSEYQRAIVEWEKVIQIDPRNVEAAFFISKTQVLLNFEKRTQNLYKQAEFYLEQKQYEQAIECYQQLSKLDHDNISLALKIDELQDLTKVHSIMQEGLDLYLKHKHEEAISVLNNIFTIDPDNIDAKNYIIQARAKINESVKVKEIFRIGLVHYRDKKWKQAISRFEDVNKFVGPYQKDAGKYIKLAREQLAKETKIKKFLKAGLDIYQQEHKDTASKIWGASAAIKQWENVLEIEPNHKEAKDYIAKAKLIIQRSKLMVESQAMKTSPGVIEIPPTVASETITLKKPAKKVEKTKPFKMYDGLTENIIGAICGGAVGDALGVGTSWLTFGNDYSAPITDYQKNTADRFRAVPRGEVSGEMVLTFKVAGGIINGASFHPKDLLKAMLKFSRQLQWPMEKSTELLLLRLRKGMPWKQAVLVKEDDFAPLYRALIVAMVYIRDEPEMVNRVKSATYLTHKNQDVVACCLAGAFAITYIITFKNQVGKSRTQLIGSTGTQPRWDNNEFLKYICSKIESSNKNMADRIMELMIYSSMPSDRFFETVGMSDKAEETLLSALFCFLKHQDNFTDAVTLAVNARGISKHTAGNRHGIAALTGFLSGAYNGFIDIPHQWINGLMQHDLIFNIASDLCRKFEPK